MGLAPTTNFLLWSLVYYVTTMINSSWLVNIKCASSYEVAFFLLSIRTLKTSLHEFPISGCKYFLQLNCNLQLKRVYYDVYPIITKLRKEATYLILSSWMKTWNPGTYRVTNIRSWVAVGTSSACRTFHFLLHKYFWYVNFQRSNLRSWRDVTWVAHARQTPKENF